MYRKPQAQFFSTVADQSRSRFQDRTYSTLTRSRFEHSEEEDNKKLLADLKFTVHQKKIEELDQVSCQQKLDLQINKETWEKFHILKKSQDKKQGQVVSYTELLRDNKYVIYLAGAAQMV